MIMPEYKPSENEIAVMSLLLSHPDWRGISLDDVEFWLTDNREVVWITKYGNKIVIRLCEYVCPNGFIRAGAFPAGRLVFIYNSDLSRRMNDDPA